MNPDPASPSPPGPFRPVSLLLGFALGFALLVALGHATVRRDFHPKFTRFHPHVAPETLYYPTVAEMASIVRTRCRPDQVLVIVGGNSILYGVGQPAEKMWTRRLQEMLGDRYVVINFAFRGAGPTDGGAVLAEVLRDEYPRMIYVTNTAPRLAADVLGGRDYRFLLLDAQRRGLLLPWPVRDQGLESDSVVAPEARLGARLNAWLHFNEFWNAWSVERFSTVPSTLLPTFASMTQPRGQARDTEGDYEMTPFNERFKPEFFAKDFEITQNYSERFYTRSPEGTWLARRASDEEFKGFADTAFPTPLRARTLVLISRNSPYYTNRLTAAERERDELAIRDSLSLWEASGYAALDTGRGFVPEDYGDRTHLTASGGLKLAQVTAPKVRALAAQLGYLKP